jgi:hypothetical protein
MIADQIEVLKETLEETLLKETRYTNLAKTERILSLATGTFLLFKGLTNAFSHPIISSAELFVGFGLMQRGISGYCPIAEKLENGDLESEQILLIESN